MMLVPTTGPSATAADMPLVRSRPIAPETDALIVAVILAARKAPCALEFALPASTKALTPIGVLVAPEPLVADSRGAVSFVVVCYLDLGTSPERSCVPDGSSRPSNPVYERLYHPRISSTHLLLLSWFLFVIPHSPFIKQAPCQTKLLMTEISVFNRKTTFSAH